VDLSDLDPITQIALAGRPVQAILEGVVAAAIQDRFPYGNTIIIETPLGKLPKEWLRAISPRLSDEKAVNPRLTCPETEKISFVPSTEQSIYLLYAHLKKQFSLQLEETVNCGQIIGQVGNSGNSLNPHLHIEVRIGPTGNRFESMAHYDSSATPEEMANYCLWRVSGHFMLIDPMDLLSAAP
jgi:murein DD-endopeptidase MepM/ murein hydrolase activator NlpD